MICLPSVFTWVISLDMAKQMQIYVGRQSLYDIIYLCYVW